MQNPDPHLPNMSALGTPHPVHKIEDLVQSILAKLDGDGDAGAACKMVASFCSTDKAHRGSCASSDAPWRELVERTFRSTPVDRALFSYDAQLQDRPKFAFTEACFDRALARIAACDFLARALPAIRKQLYEEWRSEVLERGEDEVVRAEDHEDRGLSADAIEGEFLEDYPVAARFAEWRMLAEEKYDEYTAGVQNVYEDEIRAAFPLDGDNPRLGWVGHEASGLGVFGQGLANICADGGGHPLPVRAGSHAPHPKPTLTELWANAHENVHAMAERVGRATIFAHHAGITSVWGTGAKAIRRYVLRGVQDGVF